MPDGARRPNNWIWLNCDMSVKIGKPCTQLLNVFSLIQLVGYEIVIGMRRMLDKQVLLLYRRIDSAWVAHYKAT